MNSNRYKYYLAIPTLLISLSAYAHEGEDHAEEAQELDCSAMEGTDHAAADVSDPVMQAMMMKCHAQMAEAEMHATQGHGAEDLAGKAHEEAAHEHEAGGHANAAVTGSVAEHGHTDGAADSGHTDH